MDAAASEHAALVGWFEGAAIAAGFAATHPSRVDALIIGSFTAQTTGAGDEPWGIDPQVVARIERLARDAWGTGEIAKLVAPSMASDARFLGFWGRYERMSASPQTAERMIRWNNEIDIRAILPAIRVPSLVVHRTHVNLVRTGAIRYVAEQIPGARYLDLPGQDIFPFVGDSDAILDAIQQFLTGNSTPIDTDRRLATVLFTDIVNSTVHADRLGDSGWAQLIAAHHKDGT